MVVEMVVGYIGEYGTTECESVDSALMKGVGTYLHETVLASFVHHHAHQSVESDGVLSGIGRLEPFGADVVGYCRQQAAAVSQICEQVVEQGGNGGFAVCPRHAYQIEVPARVQEKIAGYRCGGGTGVLNQYGCYPAAAYALHGSGLWQMTAAAPASTALPM